MLSIVQTKKTPLHFLQLSQHFCRAKNAISKYLGPFLVIYNTCEHVQ